MLEQIGQHNYIPTARNNMIISPREEELQQQLLYILCSSKCAM